jgi:hypothetical protein
MNYSSFNRHIISGVVLLLLLSPISLFFGDFVDAGNASVEDQDLIFMASLSQQEEKVIDYDWYISANQVIEIKNQTIILNGDLIINATGRLSLFNVTLIFNNTQIEDFDLIVNENATLYLDQSKLTASNSELGTRVLFKPHSIVTIRNSNLSNLGLNTSQHYGINIFSDNVLLDNCVVTNNTYGLFLNNSSPTLTRLTISDCTFGLFGVNTGTTIQNCKITNCDNDIKLTQNSNLVAIDSKFNSYKLTGASKIIKKSTLDVQIIFDKPILIPIKNADVQVLNNDNIVYSTKGFGGTNNKSNKDGKIGLIIVIDKILLENSTTKHVTTLSVKYKTRMKANKSVNFSKTQSKPKPSVHAEVINFSNHLPVLSQFRVQPWAGWVGENFWYSVKYTDGDNDTPSKMVVEIDGEEFQLTSNSGDTDWINGTWFNLNTTLAAGDHEFRYLANDGCGFADVIAPAGNGQYLSGPIVNIKNSDPVLSKGSVTPEVGNPNTDFKFTIQYFDANNDPPRIAKIYINNIPHDMTLRTLEEDDEEDDDEDDIIYEFIAKLPEGEHEFYFKFQDNNDSSVVRWPDEFGLGDVVTGPIVKPFKNQVPIIGNGTVSPKIGHKLIWYSYTISYYDPENDLPSRAQVIIDGVPFNLTQARIAQNIYFYETYLPLGEHYFHFEFEDQIHNHYLRFPTDDGYEILGPLVYDYPPVLANGNVTPTKGSVNTTFDFSILYLDPENDYPLNASVVIDNSSFELKRINYQTDHNSEGTDNDLNSPEEENENNNNTKYGEILKFSYSTQLSLGEHNFYFLISSGDFLLRYPATGYLSGPVVTEEDDFDPEIIPKNSSDEINNDTNNYSDNENKSSNSLDDNELDNETSSDSKSDKPSIELDGKIIFNSHEVREFEGPMGTEYMFIVYCKISPEYLKGSMCWLYLNDNTYLMNQKPDVESNGTKFILNIQLTPGLHSYHFLFKIGDSMIRYPHRGEFRGPTILDTLDNGNTTESAERGMNEPQLGEPQLAAIAILIVSFIIGSYYYTYISPKKWIK